LKIRFLIHNVYGAGGGVLTVINNLARTLSQRHDVEIVSVLRTADQPVHQPPDGVMLRSLADVRPDAHRSRTRGALARSAIRRPSRLIPTEEPHYGSYSLYSDLMLRRYLQSVQDGVLVGMQPGVNLAIARFAPDSVVRIGQDHRPFVVRKGQLLDEMRKYLPRLDAFLTLTRTDARRYRKVFRGSPPVRAMPNATPQYHGRVSDHSHKVVTAAGHLSRDKGFDRLVAAWAIVHERHPDWELRIFGTGKRMAELMEQIAALGLTDSARLMGYSTRLWEEMADSSIFVGSSRIEGYAMVLMEAMACGLPVISFDCPTGPRDIITHGVDGLLVPNGDVEGMGKAIISLIEVGDQRLAMGQAAVSRAKSRSQKKITRRWERVMQSKMDAKQPS
jgi:glycosyltransferase involved in cell wall biosynthesis